MTGAAEAMHAQARAFATAPEVLARAGAEALVEELQRQLIRDTGGDRRLRNLKASAPVPRVELREGEALVSAGGAVWAILESGTRPHTVRAKRSRRSEALLVDGKWRSGPVRVAGTRGKRTYSRGVTVATPRVMAAQSAAWSRLHG